MFAAAPSCEVIHGTIYTCLRAMFGLSVIGILVSIFSCMLVYQILRSVLKLISSKIKTANMDGVYGDFVYSNK